VGCRRSLEESGGDRTGVYTRIVTTPYTTLPDSTPVPLPLLQVRYRM
jgi:hypothetical protein